MSERQHSSPRPSMIRRLWFLFAAVLVLSVIADFWVHHYDHFGIEDSFGFYAWYGFGAAMAVMVVAKLLGIFLRRKDTYYDE